MTEIFEEQKKMRRQHQKNRATKKWRDKLKREGFKRREYLVTDLEDRRIKKFLSQIRNDQC